MKIQLFEDAVLYNLLISQQGCFYNVGKEMNDLQKNNF